ncbi:MAG: hypothetical protein M3355_12065 [Actinomycetota bacterium]|nr:hypothetical protein [Actinomycetota bacterium]
MAADQGSSHDNVKIVLLGPDGEVKQEETIHNLIVTVAGMRSWISYSPPPPLPSRPTWPSVLGPWHPPPAIPPSGRK